MSTQEQLNILCAVIFFSAPFFARRLRLEKGYSISSSEKIHFVRKVLSGELMIEEGLRGGKSWLLYVIFSSSLITIFSVLAQGVEIASIMQQVWASEVTFYFGVTLVISSWLLGWALRPRQSWANELFFQYRVALIVLFLAGIPAMLIAGLSMFAATGQAKVFAPLLFLPMVAAFLFLPSLMVRTSLDEKPWYKDYLAFLSCGFYSVFLPTGLALSEGGLGGCVVILLVGALIFGIVQVLIFLQTELIHSLFFWVVLITPAQP